MPYLTQPDLSTHIYPELIAEITREDATVATRAIDAAIAEAKSYLSRYDLAQLFAATPVPNDENLKNKVKDIACWHLVKLANPNISIEMFRDAYEDAIKWLDKIMKGQMNPDGWIYRDTSTDTTPPQGNAISYSSNTKRRHHF